MPNGPIKENEFFPAPAGVGSINGQPGYGTFASPQNSQNPNSFESSNNNKAIAHSNTAKEAPDTGSMAKDVQQIYSKRKTPSVDEVVAGLKYEMGQQIKKDKFKAKEIVLQNLKKDPEFYSGLKMLNIDDQDMDTTPPSMNEAKHPNDNPARTKITPNVAETKKIFEDLVNAKGQKYVVNSGIVDAMKETLEQKRQRSAWKNS